MAMNPLESVGGQIDPHTGLPIEWRAATQPAYQFGDSGFSAEGIELLRRAGLWSQDYESVVAPGQWGTDPVFRAQARNQWAGSPEAQRLAESLAGYTQGQSRKDYTLTDYLRDPSGNVVASNSYENKEGWHQEDYLKAASVLGAAAGAGYWGGPGTAGAGATEAGIGTLGTIAPSAATSAVAPLATTGLASTAPLITATVPQVAGAAAAAGGIKTLGTIAPSAATEAVAPLATTGLESTAPLFPSAIPQVNGGALPATGAAPTPNATPSTSAPGGAMDWSDWAKIGATLISSGIQSNAANNAVDAQAASTQAAIDEQRRQFDLQRADGAPYREAGTNALSQFQTLTNTPTTAADVMQDPGYQFGLDQGQQAIDRKIAAMGGRVSGSAIKAAGRFGTNYATTGYTAADQRRNDRLNRFAALAGIGQSATNASASAGSAMANNISGMVTGQGNAAGGAMLAQGNIWGNTANQLAALYGRGNQQSSVNIPTGPFSNYGGDYNGLGYQP